MEFLLNLASCYRKRTDNGSRVIVVDDEATRHTRPSVADRRLYRKRGVTRVGPTGGHGNDNSWKPTLEAISEDMVFVTVAPVEKGRVERVVERRGHGDRGGGGARDVASLPSYCDDYRQNWFSFLSTFTAAPFMI